MRSHYACNCDILRAGSWERTENTRHDSNAWILDLALGVVHPQSLQGRETNGFMTAGHFRDSLGTELIDDEND